MTVIRKYNPATSEWEIVLVGRPGPQGDAATVEAGTTTTGAPGTDASVVNSGTSSDAVFDFTIPRGDTGFGVVPGGVADDLLVKQSSTDYDTAWADEITVDRLTLDPASGDAPLSDGELTWDVDEGTVAVGMNDNVVGRVIEHSMYRVKADEAISKGDLCMAVGTVGNSGQILVAKARPSYGALTDIPSQRLMGLAANTMANGDQGYVVAFGKLRQVNTSVWSEGDILWADPAVPGGLTATRPAAGNWRTIVALVVTDSVTVGELFVRPTFGSDLGNDERVELSSPADGDVLAFDGVSGVWENRPGGVPSGGTTGQVLAKASATDYDTEWVAQSGGSFGLGVLTQSVGRRFVPGLIRTAWTEPVLTAVNGETYYWPLVIREAVTFDAFCPFVHVAQAASTCRLAVCSADSDFQPVSLIADSGGIATTTTGEKVSTTTKTTLQPGRYLASLRANAAVQFRGISAVAADGSFGTNAADSLFFVPRRLVVSEGYGAYSQTPTAWTSVVMAGFAGLAAWQVPVILRSAAP